MEKVILKLNEVKYWRIQMSSHSTKDSLQILMMGGIPQLDIRLVDPHTGKVKNLKIDPVSLLSIPITLYSEGVVVNNATGFIIYYQDKGHYLITNKHVFTSRDQNGNQVAAGPAPTHVEIYLHKMYKDDTQKFGEYVKIKRKLVDSQITWLQHPHNPEYDVVAMKLEIKTFLAEGERAKIVCLDFKKHAAKNLLTLMPPTSRLSIVGYPKLITANSYLPIWKTGHLATEYAFNYEGKPVFLTDTSTWPGMSGSPIIARASNGFLVLLGVHSSSYYYKGTLKGMDITKAWKTDVIDDIVLADKEIENIIDYINSLLLQD